MWICFSIAIPEPAPLAVRDEIIERVSSHKLLGVWYQDNLKWNRHVDEMVRKANKRLFCLKRMPQSQLSTRGWSHLLYQAKIRPVLEYGADYRNT